MLDALINLVTGRAGGASPKAVNVMVDHAAWARGHTNEGEVCEIAGVGPIPVASAQAMAGDAFVKVLVSDGTDIQRVAHVGRNIPAHIRSALIARDTRCVVPGCEVTVEQEPGRDRQRDPVAEPAQGSEHGRARDGAGDSAPERERERSPQGGPGSGEHEQRRRHEHQQHVLDHVDGEELLGEPVERGEREEDRRQCGVEGERLPKLLGPTAPASTRDGSE